MTHSTDAERAEFEAWLGIKPCGAAHDLAWSAWKAARRAPVAPVPQGWRPVPVVPTQEMIDAACNDGVSLNGRPVWKQTVDVQAAWRWGAMLAAAPQPPEAATVELPEYGIDTANHAGIRVRGYTEQQVRELLAANGIGKDKA